MLMYLSLLRAVKEVRNEQSLLYEGVTNLTLRVCVYELIAGT
jgi:hypothetical protein